LKPIFVVKTRIYKLYRNKQNNNTVYVTKASTNKQRTNAGKTQLMPGKQWMKNWGIYFTDKWTGHAHGERSDNGG